MGRFGQGFMGPREAVDKKARDALRQNCRIVGGPLVVRCGEGYRVFVAVSKCDPKVGGYLSDCVVYEIGDDGKPMAMVNMPRTVIGHSFRILPDGLLWQCERGAFAKLAPSGRSRGIGMGPFGAKSDCIGRLAWYLQPEGKAGSGDARDGAAEPWFSAAKAGDPSAFNRDTCFRLPEGGYVTRKGDKVYRFPVSRIRLPGGAAKTMTLVVPFSGRFRLPTTNYSGGATRMRSFKPHLLAVTGLAFQGKDLVIRLGGVKTSVGLHFKLSELGP
jgi:hypothetical protein